MKTLGYWLLSIAALAFISTIFMFPDIGGGNPGSSIDEIQEQTVNIYESAKLERLRGYALWIAESFSLVGAIFVASATIASAIRGVPDDSVEDPSKLSNSD